MSSVYPQHCIKSQVTKHTGNPGTQEVEAGGQEFKLECDYIFTSRNPGLPETQSQKSKRRKKEGKKVTSEFAHRADKMSRSLTSHSGTGPLASAEGLGVEVRPGAGWQGRPTGLAVQPLPRQQHNRNEGSWRAPRVLPHHTTDFHSPESAANRAQT